MIPKTIFVYNTFLRTLLVSDIDIVDSNDVVKYIINPNSIKRIYVFNNLLKIDTTDGNIFLNFSSNTEVNLAMPILQSRIDTLKSRVFTPITV